MTSDGATAFVFASDNRLATARGLNLIYDPLGRLTWIQNQGRVTDYTGDQVVAELSVGSYAVQRRFVYGPGVDEPLVWYEGAGTSDRLWLHADERGSVVAISNASGVVARGSTASTNRATFATITSTATASTGRSSGGTSSAATLGGSSTPTPRARSSRFADGGGGLDRSGSNGVRAR